MSAPARKANQRPRQARRDPSPSPIAALAATLAEMQADLRGIHARLDALSGPPLPPLPEGFVNLRTAARESGFSAEAVRLWAISRAIGAMRRGGAWFVKLDDVRAYCRRRFGNLDPHAKPQKGW